MAAEAGRQGALLTAYRASAARVTGGIAPRGCKCNSNSMNQAEPTAPGAGAGAGVVFGIPSAGNREDTRISRRLPPLPSSERIMHYVSAYSLCEARAFVAAAVCS
jgi:hypothetical protein